MLRTHSSRARAASVTAMLLLGATLLLAACGGSGKSTSQTNPSASTSKSDAHSAPTGKSGAQDSGGTAAGRATKGKRGAPSSAGKAAGVLSGAAVSKFAACLSKYGVTPTGNGSASRADTKSARYKAAVAKCARELGGSGGLDLSKIHLKNVHVKVNPGEIHVKVSPNQIRTGLPKGEQPPTGTGTSP
jgi:hypothetical protein